MSTQPPLNYVDYDFDTLVQQLQNRLQLQPAWKDMYRSATGQMLLELFAAVGTLVLYYIERRAEESYIGTAQNKSSLINLVRLLAYTPQRNVSATGTLRWSIAAPLAVMVFIPKNSIAATSGNVQYLVSSDGVIMPGQTYVDVSGIQGTLVSLNYTSTGSLNQEYNILDTKVENSSPEELYTRVDTEIEAQTLVSSLPGSRYELNVVGTYSIYVLIDYTRPKTIEVRVNDTIWTQVDSFANSVNTSQHYKIRAELDDTVTILFGDNVFGKSPALSDSISVTYIQSEGLTGNVYSTGSITNPVSTILDEDGDTVTVTVTNTGTFLGGDDAETTEEIRLNGPAVFSTGERLVTKADFAAVIKAYPSVADVNVWGESEETPPNYDLFNTIRLSIILQSWVFPDSGFEAKMTTFLYNKSTLTVKYEYIDPVIIDIVPTLYVRVQQGASLSYVQSLIEIAMASQFVLGTTTKLSVSKRHSDIVRIVEEVPGVSYCHIKLKISKELLDTYNSTYDYGETVDALPLEPNTVEIYKNSTQIGVDDGAGGFAGLTSAITVSGAVNYTSGLMGVDISPAPAAEDVIYVRYLQDNSATDEDGDVVVTKNQVCRQLNDVYDTISYVD